MKNDVKEKQKIEIITINTFFEAADVNRIKLILSVIGHSR
jgi:hypothetical protein